ncbi:MAG: hypothetical protein EOP40_13120 [Rubrivivax sp.]|nr:MAG: hypothetical protein EOP40_13120 [Rubrivivax sp.]
MQEATGRIGILGVGYAVPDRIRGNDDPIFDWLREHNPPGTDLFKGLKYRRVLDTPEGVVGIMVQSAQGALADAGLQLADIDMLLGSGSVSQFNAPNDLCLVHHHLGLPSTCRVMALNTEYTNFHDGMKLAHELAQGGAIRNALVVCGNNWTHHMDYHEPVSLVASDGAGAAVVGPTQDERRFGLIDWDNETQSHYYRALRQTPRPSPDHEHLYTTSLMKVDDKTGVNAVKEFGLPVPGQIVNRMLARHGLTGADITLVAHQSSLTVYQAWNTAIQPALYISTLEDYGDMVSSSVPVNLAKCYDDIRTEHLVLMGTGMEMHATALLYRRGQG